MPWFQSTASPQKKNQLSSSDPQMHATVTPPKHELVYDYSIQHVSVNLDCEPWYVWFGRKKKRLQGRHTVPEIKRRRGKVKLCHVVLGHYYLILPIPHSLTGSDSGLHVLDTEVIVV